jgi:hypothetical protein
MREVVGSKLLFWKYRKTPSQNQTTETCVKSDIPSLTAVLAAASLVGTGAMISALDIFGGISLGGTMFGIQRYQLLLSGSYFVFFVAAGIPGRLDQQIGM